MNIVSVSILSGLVVLAGIYVWLQRENESEKKKKIPGPKLVDKRYGHSLDMQAAGNMSQYLRKMHKIYGPVFGFYKGSTYIVSLGSAAVLNQCRKLFDRPKFLDEVFGPLLGWKSLQVSSGEGARIRHAAYTRFLSFGAIGPFYPTIQKKSVEMCDSWASKQEPFAVYQDLRKYTIMAVEIIIFRGYVPDDKEILEIADTYEQCWREAEKWLKGDMIEPGSEREKQFNHNRDIINSIVRSAFKKSMNNKTPGEITFSQLAKDLGLDDDTILDDMVTFIVGGYHNSSYIMEWGMYYLAKYPHMQDKLRSEIEQILGNEPVTPEAVKHLVYLRQFMDELHRWTTVGQLAARIAYEDIQIDGYVIPAKTEIVQALETVHCDESVYKDPDRFDPDRFSPEKRKTYPPHSLEPFGFSGGRRCIGAQIYTNEAIILFTTLVQKLHLSLPPNQGDIKKELGTFSRPEENVRIIFSRR